jgi:hypothetical protein
MKNFHFFKKSSSEFLSPRKEFTEKTKSRFLATFDAHYGTRPQERRSSSQGIGAWAKGFATLLSLAAIMVGVSAYADTANVAADSPLYPFKRLTENVQLALTPMSSQGQFEATLATRRAHEIDDLSVRMPSSTLIGRLSLDFQTDVSSSLKDIGSGKKKGKNGGRNAAGTRFEASGTASTSDESDSDTDGSSEDASIVCNQVSAILSNSTSVRLNLLSNRDLLKRFEDRCGEDEGSSAVASGTTSASASTTILIVPGEHGDDRGGIELNIEGDDGLLHK